MAINMPLPDIRWGPPNTHTRTFKACTLLLAPGPGSEHRYCHVPPGVCWAQVGQRAYGEPLVPTHVAPGPRRYAPPQPAHECVSREPHTCQAAQGTWLQSSIQVVGGGDREAEA